MTAPTLEELLQHGGEHARLTMVGRTDEMTPIAHLVQADGNDIIIGTPWADEREKAITLAMLAALARAGDAIRYMVLHEAWMAKAPEGAKLDDPPPVMPRDDPNRMEIVVAAAVERGRRIVRVWETKRDADGKCIDLVEQPDGGDWQGEFLGLLPMDA
jgi:hypothetical protein